MKTNDQRMRSGMIYTSLLFSILLSMLSCKDNVRPESESEVASVTATGASVPMPYAGEWISEDYLNRIKSTGSPRQAQENIEACYIRIPATTQKSTAMIYNFHESGAEMVVLQETEKFILREKPQSGIEPVTLTIEPLGSDKIRLGEKNFVRIQSVSGDQDARILEEILFKGAYTTKEGKKVEFKNNGEVSGLEGYTQYVPVIDYFDAGLQVDQVGLGMSRDDLTYFGFKFDGDRLVLYKLNCLTYDQNEKRCVEVDFGEKIHELRRAK